MPKTIVAVIDAGGRGSALIEAYAKSPKVNELIAIPGNDLMQINTQKPVHIFPGLKTTSKAEILEICRDFNVTLIDVAQDNAIEAGVSDLLRENGFDVVGSSKLAGQIEWDKTFARKILEQTRALQPEYASFNNFQEGIDYINSRPDQPYFIKASGLAEGKGAMPAKNKIEGIMRIEELKKFGKSGESFLIEDWLIGEEFSAFAVSDGTNFDFLGFAQDYKRALDGDLGENTGGMGCSTPPLVVTENIAGQAYELITETLLALKGDNRPFQGIIYLGGIVVENKVYVIEYNARWGDPEVECILPGIENDWFDVGMACAQGKLDQIKIKHDGKSRVVIAACSKGYPGDYSQVKGREITGFDELMKTPDIKVYGAGTKKADGKYTANGGRLFYVAAEGSNVIQAREKAYSALEKVSITGGNGEDLLHYRKDIGYRDATRLQGE